MFVTFEGPEGGGKSTAIKWVAARLKEDGFQVLQTREPGAGELGIEIRKLLLHGGGITGQTELLLFLADRSNHVANIIRPALEGGNIVLCDRYADSTLVYQGFGRGFDLGFLREANRFATGDLQPDLTLLFDLPPELGLSRIVDKDRIDREPLEFHHRIRTGFLQCAEEEPDRWEILDATKAPGEVAEAAHKAIKTWIELPSKLPGEGG